MATFIIRRVLLMIPVIWGITTVVFLLLFVFVPGDPARVLLGQHGDEQTLQLIKQKYGLDKPLYIQYGCFYKNLLQGDLGYSFRKKQPVLDVIADRSGHHQAGHGVHADRQHRGDGAGNNRCLVSEYGD